MSFTLEVEHLVEQGERIKKQMLAVVESLPDNPRIRRFPDNPNCFVIRSSDLGNNWSVEHHDFKAQYRGVCAEIERRSLDKVLPWLRNVVEYGFYVDTQKQRHNVHPDVREHLRRLI